MRAHPECAPAAACADLATLVLYRRSPELRLQAVARAARDDFPAWLSHVQPAAACTRPVRLAGTLTTIEAATGRILDLRHTADMPDGTIYKPCGNRRASVCPACSKRYQNDAYQLVRAGLVGGKGVPAEVARHPAVFPTFTAPSFGEVHTRRVKKHTCARRTECDCRAEPCHARRDLTVCPHGARLACFARHDLADPRLGTPLCLDCYDHAGQVVWNLYAGELWRRTTITIRRYIEQLCRERGVAKVSMTYERNGTIRTRWVLPVRLSFGKAAEMQRRGVAHFHAIIRLDGFDPDRPDSTVAPPAALDADDLVAAVDHAATTVVFATVPHPHEPGGWRIGWGDQVLTKVITVAALGEVTDAQVAAYLAKYATKSTEVTGHTSGRITTDTIDLYADQRGTHVERLVDACWRLAHARWTCKRCGQHSDRWVCPTCAARGREALWPVPESSPFRRLGRWAHMLGFGGHFLTKSRHYSITFALLRNRRVVFQRARIAGPEHVDVGETPTTLVVNFLQFVGAGWQTPADAMLANTSAAMAREHQNAARHYLTSLAA
ncbi:replication initiator [Actinoplanes palleronii]|uniref:Plasmid replication initiator protein n=1 Tax=Actinoplanes palleronii TaxID=113570 RepID=A0ABQ4B1L5_9ACTN|nr:replication initiator [Actinoplanes palleronii]GIE64562.1 plasmid replication initiator protein [Actinoplanes palleronii]